MPFASLTSWSSPSRNLPVRSSCTCSAPSITLKDYAYTENRYTMLTKSNPEAARRLMALAEGDVKKRWKRYEELAQENGNGKASAPDPV